MMCVVMCVAQVALYMHLCIPFLQWGVGCDHEQQMENLPYYTNALTPNSSQLKFNVLHPTLCLTNTTPAEKNKQHD